MALPHWCSTALGRVACLWSREELRRLPPGRTTTTEANKRTVLGLLTWLVGFTAALSPEGLALGVPLIAVGIYLSVVPYLRTA